MHDSSHLVIGIHQTLDHFRSPTFAALIFKTLNYQNNVFLITRNHHSPTHQAWPPSNWAPPGHWYKLPRTYWAPCPCQASRYPTLNSARGCPSYRPLTYDGGSHHSWASSRNRPATPCSWSVIQKELEITFNSFWIRT